MGKNRIRNRVIPKGRLEKENEALQARCTDLYNKLKKKDETVFRLKKIVQLAEPLMDDAFGSLKEKYSNMHGQNQLELAHVASAMHDDVPMEESLSEIPLPETRMPRGLCAEKSNEKERQLAEVEASLQSAQEQVNECQAVNENSIIALQKLSQTNAALTVELGRVHKELGSMHAELYSMRSIVLTTANMTKMLLQNSHMKIRKVMADIAKSSGTQAAQSRHGRVGLGGDTEAQQDVQVEGRTQTLPAPTGLAHDLEKMKRDFLIKKIHDLLQE